MALRDVTLVAEFWEVQECPQVQGEMDAARKTEAGNHAQLQGQPHACSLFGSIDVPMSLSA
jgi:hypothetical protein